MPERYDLITYNRWEQKKKIEEEKDTKKEETRLFGKCKDLTGFCLLKI